jgi:hypothetical protein
MISSQSWPHRHKTFEHSQGNSQLKYLRKRMVELEISSTLITFLDVSMHRLRKFSAAAFSDSDIWVENFLKNTQKFYDIGAWCLTDYFSVSTRLYNENNTPSNFKWMSDTSAQRRISPMTLWCKDTLAKTRDTQKLLYDTYQGISFTIRYVSLYTLLINQSDKNNKTIKKSIKHM